MLLAVLLPLSNCVMANNNEYSEPILSGSVYDAFSRKPLQGVTISITSSKHRIEKFFTTDADGKFNIPELPPGEVTIILEKKGYKTCKREKIVVKEGSPVKMNFDIRFDKEENEENNFFHPLLRMMRS